MKQNYCNIKNLLNIKEKNCFKNKMQIFKNGRFKGKSLVSTSENIDEIGVSTVKLKSSNGRTINGFLFTSEDIYLLEDNKRIEDINNIHTEEKGKSTLSAGVSYTKILDGADEEHITGRFKGGSDFDILVAHKNEHSIGLNVKYALELENGVLFDVKGTYAVERDSHNQPGKNKTKGEWIVGAGLGYKF